MLETPGVPDEPPSGGDCKHVRLDVIIADLKFKSSHDHTQECLQRLGLLTVPPEMQALRRHKAPFLFFSLKDTEVVKSC